MHLTFETELETDGRWIAEVPELPGVMVYGKSESEAVGKAEALALGVLTERVERDNASSKEVQIAANGGFEFLETQRDYMRPE